MSTPDRYSGAKARSAVVSRQEQDAGRIKIALLALGGVIVGMAVLLGMGGEALAAKAQPWQLGLPDPVTPLAKEMGAFHNYWLLPVITVIAIFVLILLIYVCFRFRESANPVPSKTTHHTLLEVVWITVPVLILATLAIPSLKLLYHTDEIADSEMTMKVIGHQWYWEYQYPDHGNFTFEAYVAARTHEQAAEAGVHRLMDTDNVVVLPADTKIRLQFTSADVLHNWSLSDFGVRVDTVPGRLNEAWTLVEKPGMYYGFCSELCGTDHAFMPIAVKVVPKAEFAAWVAEAQEKFAKVDEIENPVEIATGGVGEAR